MKGIKSKAKGCKINTPKTVMNYVSNVFEPNSKTFHWSESRRDLIAWESKYQLLLCNKFSKMVNMADSTWDNKHSMKCMLFVMERHQIRIFRELLFYIKQ